MRNDPNFSSNSFNTPDKSIDQLLEEDSNQMSRSNHRSRRIFNSGGQNPFNQNSPSFMDPGMNQRDLRINDLDNRLRLNALPSIRHLVPYMDSDEKKDMLIQFTMDIITKYEDTRNRLTQAQEEANTQLNKYTTAQKNFENIKSLRIIDQKNYQNNLNSKDQKIKEWEQKYKDQTKQIQNIKLAANAFGKREQRMMTYFRNRLAAYQKLENENASLKTGGMQNLTNNFGIDDKKKINHLIVPDPPLPPLEADLSESGDDDPGEELSRKRFLKLNETINDWGLKVAAIRNRVFKLFKKVKEDYVKFLEHSFQKPFLDILKELFPSKSFESQNFSFYEINGTLNFNTHPDEVFNSIVKMIGYLDDIYKCRQSVIRNQFNLVKKSAPSEEKILVPEYFVKLFHLYVQMIKCFRKQLKALEGHLLNPSDLGEEYNRVRQEIMDIKEGLKEFIPNENSPDVILAMDNRGLNVKVKEVSQNISEMDGDIDLMQRMAQRLIQEKNNPNSYLNREDFFKVLDDLGIPHGNNQTVLNNQQNNNPVIQNNPQENSENNRENISFMNDNLPNPFEMGESREFNSDLNQSNPQNNSMNQGNNPQNQNQIGQGQNNQIQGNQNNFPQVFDNQNQNQNQSFGNN
ncbi:MAG: hypothetical protein MJ252_27145, partial [archaeon]|nr:hypothetical protein [archaeon]